MASTKSKLVEDFTKELKHFFNCIDFGNSNLDAQAIRFMNAGFGKICDSHDDLLTACENITKHVRKVFTIDNHRLIAYEIKPVYINELVQAIAKAKA